MLSCRRDTVSDHHDPRIRVKFLLNACYNENGKIMAVTPQCHMLLVWGDGLLTCSNFSHKYGHKNSKTA